MTNAPYGSGLRPAAAAAGDDPTRARGRDRRPRTAAGDRRRLERRAGDDRPARHRRDPAPTGERCRRAAAGQLVGRAAGLPRGAARTRRGASLRLRARPVAGGAGRAVVRLGLHRRAVGCDVRRRLHARSPPITGRPSRPTPIPSRATSTSGCTRSRPSIASSASARTSCRRCTTPATSPRHGRTTEPPFGESYAAYHDGSAHRPAARTWAPWYRDWMTGRLRRLGAKADADADGRGDADAGERAIGLTPDRWALRSG